MSETVNCKFPGCRNWAFKDKEWCTPHRFFAPGAAKPDRLPDVSVDAVMRLSPRELAAKLTTLRREATAALAWCEWCNDDGKRWQPPHVPCPRCAPLRAAIEAAT